MRFALTPRAQLAALSVALVPLLGCPIVADILDPTLAGQLGLGTTGSQGVVIVAFNNDTRFNVEFFAYESVDAQDLTRDSRNFTAQVTSGNVANEVLDCPVEVFAPGSLSADFAQNTLAATVTTDGGAVSVNYLGPPLETPDFSCGDVIEVRVQSTGAATDAEGAFEIVVRVIPG